VERALIKRQHQQQLQEHGQQNKETDAQVAAKRRRTAADEAAPPPPVHPTAVLDAELSEPVPTVDVWSATVVDRKATAALVRALSAARPLFHHLKRVRCDAAGRLSLLVDTADRPAQRS